ncbi:hypothetical protein DY000_02023753 [Brassica cretica]|uniref:Ubiquitin-like protease family profile domain-containing protein n=1 Tax=Brassica cretica TaxID=69181 RepID=A0ABQ7E9B6_BRACR|nr:hypothetical protein DY000_02023753 [Brassica cretica]
MDIDDVYAPVNYNDTHWIAMWISIPKRHIVVWDSICSSISPEDLDVVMEPFLYMVPYLLVECASSDEQHSQYSLEPFTYERPTNIPSARAGDCGVYTLKYIECHALGIEFSKKYFAKANGKTMRDKMAVDIFQELPDAHEFENKDNDANRDDLPISRIHIDAWINMLRKRYDANPQHFRSERMCFLDHLFSQQWRFNYKDFKDSEPDQNVNYNDTHGIAMWISIPKRHIVVWDNICSSISPEDLDVVMESFLYMVPYLLVECASSDEQRAQNCQEPFTYERPTNIPPARAGDCGVYTLKYIECHALGINFSKKDFAKANRKTMKDKMAVDIFQELPDAHKFENKDNDGNLGAYEG